MKKIHQRLENIARMHEARLSLLNQQAHQNLINTGGQLNSTSLSKSDSKTTLSLSDVTK